jgi:REP element-mobilizing transposase RayT
LPLHVTLRLARGLPTLRRTDTHRILREALAAGAERDGFRLVHYTAMRNHVHLVCESDDVERLGRAMQGLCVRIARALNRWWKRRGTVFDDRYHSRALRTPREVKNVLVYVLHNAHHHGLLLPEGLDPFSSADSFDGWAQSVRARSAPLAPLAIAGRGCCGKAGRSTD